MKKLSILCSDPSHPVMPWLLRWTAENRDRAEIGIVHKKAELGSGDILFLISCSELVEPEVRSRFRHALVIHASDLPHGRGWSPHIWSILEGADSLCVTLLDADDPVDSGAIWQQVRIDLDGSELHDEINAALFDAEIALMDWALANVDRTAPRPQHGEPSYYSRRRPADSRIDPHKSLAEAFELLRVADPDRYPAFFDLRGHRYKIRLEKIGPIPSDS